MNLVINLLINTFAVYIAGNVIPGVYVKGFMPALITSVVLGVLNTFLKPILLILTLPINLLTIGLFTFVINVFIVFLTSRLVTGFDVSTFLAGFLFSLLVSVISSFLQILSK